jgi:hypothetical protein
MRVPLRSAKKNKTGGAPARACNVEPFKVELEALSTAATPVAADASAKDPFALLAPEMCAVCLLEAEDAGE